MGLEVVIEEIRAKGKNESERIRKDTQAEVNSILKAAQEKAERIKLAADQDVEKQTSHIMNQEASAANLVVKRQLLNTQKDLLDQVYSDALSRIARLPEDFHRDAMKTLLAKAKAEIPEGIVHCSQRDNEILSRILSSDTSLKGYTKGAPVEIEGGVIIESKDGELQIDYSYRTFLSGVWETGLKDASGILFS
ncbi:MAG: V-type ATP synthase subunit E family protein [Methanoregulaceae archaeon]|jgi:V/A-type H+-transporting ATPase subunit E|nr:V-type ATP synthase subunit E [Methanoregulaceae archaeon]MCU0628208.1 V-type ATP synthase subunit E family protein [Methanoregulaceae archaeon]